MFNSLLFRFPFAWVKNVSKLRKTSSTTSESLYTDRLQKGMFTQIGVYNLSIVPPLVPAFYTQLSTNFFVNLPPLIGHLYSQSTVPIIKITKKI